MLIKSHGCITIKTRYGFQALSLCGFLGCFFMILALLPLIHAQGILPDFFYIASVFLVLGIVGYFLSISMVTFDLQKQQVVWTRPYIPFLKKGYLWDDTCSFQVTEMVQPAMRRVFSRRISYVVSFEIPKSDASIRLEKFKLSDLNKAKDHAKELEELVFGSRGSHFEPISNEISWKPKGPELLLSLMGVPVELDQNRFSQKAVVTFVLIVVTICVGLFTLTSHNLGTIFKSYGFIPSIPFNRVGLPWITSFFLHADIFHLVGNMYFLYVFGDNVEEYLGSFRFCALVLLAILGSHLLVLALDPLRDIPHVGASGGIFGIMLFYLLNFRRARFGYFFFGAWIKLSAWWLLLLFAVVQFVGFMHSIFYQTHVSYLGHIGGGFTGFLVWLLWGGKNKRMKVI